MRKRYFFFWLVPVFFAAGIGIKPLSAETPPKPAENSAVPPQQEMSTDEILEMLESRMRGLSASLGTIPEPPRLNRTIQLPALDSVSSEAEEAPAEEPNPSESGEN